MFNPYDWYWVATDGRLFSSARQAVVAADDEAFAAWRDAGQYPTPWPCSETGSQTSAALQEVIGPYGLFASLKDYAAAVRYNKEVGGIVIDGVRYPTDRAAQSKFGSAFLLAMADTTATFKWKLDDGTFTPSIDATTMQSVAKAAGQFVNACFLTEETVSAGIDAGTITTREQVDAAFA